MRIIHVVNSSGSNFLGNERHVLTLAIAQKKHGHSAMVMTGGPGVLTESCRENDIPAMVVSSLDSGALKPMPVEQTVQDLAGQFKEFKADLIHCHHLGMASQAIPAGNQANIPCILTLHIEFAGVKAYYEMARREGLRFSTIAVSKKDSEALKDASLCEEVYYVPNGSKAIPAGRPDRAAAPGRPQLTLVGNLMFRKGIDIALLAMVELRERLGEDCPALNIYGEGNQQAEYFKEMAQVLGLSGIVRFCGFQLDVLEHCASTDILLVASREETGPLVVQEAMSRGMPIVSTDVGEVSDMLPDSRYGRVVTVGSIVGLADGVESMLADVAAGRFDPDLPRERHRSLYTTEIMADRVEAVYEQMLFGGAPASRVPASKVPAG